MIHFIGIIVANVTILEFHIIFNYTCFYMRLYYMRVDVVELIKNHIHLYIFAVYIYPSHKCNIKTNLNIGTYKVIKEAQRMNMISFV